METFLLIVKRNTFTVYKPERNYELQYINGEPSFPYEMNRVTDYLQNLFGALAEEYNLASEQDIRCSVIFCGDESIEEILKQYFKNEQNATDETFICLSTLMEKIYNKFSSCKEIMIDLYGINYDGVNYHTSKSGGLMKRDFKLLAYTIKDADIINEI
ncbi:MAG: hypothetical protein ACI3U2_03205 [Anaerovibrio sp.]